MSVARELIIKNILTDAVKRGASDLHFSVGNNPVLRIDDNLITLEDQEIVTKEFMEELIVFLLNEDQRKKLADNREIVIAKNFDSNLRFKINVFYQKGFLSTSLRYIPYQAPTIDSLKLNPILKDLIKHKNGLIIVSGSFGSGRSTTIAAMIEEINRSRKEYIITLEDPIEYVFTNDQSIIEQREIGSDTKSYYDGLKYFEEENGDVLFLEEIGSTESIPLVLEIARGGSLVLTSVSADSATKTITRILDRFSTYDQDRIRDLLATALKAVVCQKVVLKIGGGVIMIQEILIANEAVKSSILSGSIASIDDIIHMSRKDGMLSFDHVLIDLVKSYQITSKEAMENATDKKRLSEFL